MYDDGDHDHYGMLRMGNSAVSVSRGRQRLSIFQTWKSNSDWVLSAGACVFAYTTAAPEPHRAVFSERMLMQYVRRLLNSASRFCRDQVAQQCSSH